MLHIRNTYRLTCFFLGIGLLSACSKMDHAYQDIIKNGEISYTGKADSVQAFPGNGRIALSWLLLSDPRITYCKLFWNDGKDSTVIPVNHVYETDTIYTILDNMAEGAYTFYIYTGDAEGHRSIETHVSGHVYGDQYAGSLSNRGIENARWTDGKTSIEWQAPIGNFLGLDLTYTDSTGTDRSLYISPDEDTTEIADLKEGATFKYRSMYLPDSAAIDTFYTDYATVTPVNETLVDKSTFQELVLPGDALTAYGWVLSHLWDNGIKEANGFFCKGSAFPIHYTFDMGEVMKLTRYKVWQRGVIQSPGYLYAGDNPGKWEIWGTATQPDPSGGWGGWVKLMDCQSIKPSGLPVGQVSDADKAYALAGEEFIFPDTIPQVRYIRVKVVETWSKGASQLNTMEMTFWKKIQ